MTLKPIALAAFAALVATHSQAVTVVQWNFDNLPTPVTADSLKASETFNGEQSPVLSTVGAITLARAGGQSGGATDFGLNTLSYATQGTGDLTRGLRMMVDTSGFDSLMVSWDQRNSGSASAWTQLQYTVDGGANWTAAANFQMASTTFSARVFDLSEIEGAANNAQFGLQWLAMFAPGTGSYAGTTSNYGTGGTIRYDNLTLSGTEIPAVPEPQALLLMLAGLGAMGLRLRRRNA